MKKNILITNYRLTIGGIEKTLIDLLHQIDYTKYNVDLVMLSKDGELFELLPYNINTIILNEINPSLKKKWYLLLGLIFPKQIVNTMINKTKVYDAAIAFNGYNQITDYYAALSTAKNKLIWVHTDFYERKKSDIKFRIKLFIMKNKYKYFNKIVAVSESAMNGFLKLMPKYKNKTDFMWNLIDGDSIIKRSEENNGIHLGNHFNIVMMSRLIRSKQVDRLVEIHKKLIDKNYDVKTYLMGNGPDYDYIASRVDDLKVNNSFIMLGSKKNPYPILKQSDLYVSTSKFEGLSISLLESLCLGVKIVVNNVSGVKDVALYIAPTGSATIVEPKTDAYVEAIANLIDHINETKEPIVFDYHKHNQGVLNKLESLIGE